jgi:hypothetical protein
MTANTPASRKARGYFTKRASDHLDDRDIVARYRRGESTYSIARSYQVDFKTVQRRLIHNNVAIRSLQEANLLQSKLPVGVCSICGAEFPRKHGDRKQTCSSECLAELKRRNNLRENHPAWKDGRAVYRAIMLDDLGKPKVCERCGRSDVPVEIHHKDRDRANNAPDNLEVLCINCHRRTHYYLGGSPLEKINRRRP